MLNKHSVTTDTGHPATTDWRIIDIYMQKYSVVNVNQVCCLAIEANGQAGERHREMSSLLYSCSEISVVTSLAFSI